MLKGVEPKDAFDIKTDEKLMKKCSKDYLLYYVNKMKLKFSKNGLMQCLISLWEGV